MALLVDADHQRLVGRIEIEPDDVAAPPPSSADMAYVAEQMIRASMDRPLVVCRYETRICHDIVKREHESMNYSAP